MKKLRLVFAGTPAFCLPALHALTELPHELLAIFTQPDRASGRGQKQTFSPVKNFALEKELPVFQPENFRHEESVALLANLKPDLLIVIAYGLILPSSILSIPTFGAINVHASLLPRYRGASPIQQALLEGDETTGVTIMKMDRGMDTGDIIQTESCSISKTDTAETLGEKLADLAVDPLVSVINDFAHEKVSFTPQNHDKASYASKILKEDALLHWDMSAWILDRKIRAFYPWPIAYTKMEEETVRIYKATPLDEKTTKAPGTILSVDKTGMYVACENSILCITHLQFPGGRALSSSEFSNAQKTKEWIGKTFSS